jgi:hypothetical protein
MVLLLWDHTALWSHSEFSTEYSSLILTFPMTSRLIATLPSWDGAVLPQIMQADSCLPSSSVYSPCRIPGLTSSYIPSRSMSLPEGISFYHIVLIFKG